MTLTPVSGVGHTWTLREWILIKNSSGSFRRKRSIGSVLPKYGPKNGHR